MRTWGSILGCVLKISLCIHKRSPVYTQKNLLCIHEISCACTTLLQGPGTQKGRWAGPRPWTRALSPWPVQECCACTRSLVYTQEILLCIHRRSLVHTQDLLTNTFFGSHILTRDLSRYVRMPLRSLLDPSSLLMFNNCC